MPFYLSLSTFLMSISFFAYGLFNNDAFVYVSHLSFSSPHVVLLAQYSCLSCISGSKWNGDIVGDLTVGSVLLLQKEIPCSYQLTRAFDCIIHMILSYFGKYQLTGFRSSTTLPNITGLKMKLFLYVLLLNYIVFTKS